MPGGESGAEFTVLVSPVAPAEARRDIASHLSSLSSHRAIDAVLLLSELVTNSVLHSGMGGDALIRVSVATTGAGVRVEVADTGVGLDPATLEHAQGWGLRLLDRVADRWGFSDDGGAVVWFELTESSPVAPAVGAEEAELFGRLPDREARDVLFDRYAGMSGYLARRFAGRGEDAEDLEQVAAIGLVKALERFDPDHGASFSTFASATMLGELKRHLRDKAWAIRVPRGLKEASLEVSRATTELTQRLGRTPTVGDLAAATQLSEEEVLEALQAGEAFWSISLDAPGGGDGEDFTLLDRLGAEDESLELAERWQSVAPAVRRLPERERRILYLRFYRGLTQSEIAALVGISQMHVSRLLSRSLEELRNLLGEEEPDSDT